MATPDDTSRAHIAARFGVNLVWRQERAVAVAIEVNGNGIADVSLREITSRLRLFAAADFVLYAQEELVRWQPLRHSRRKAVSPGPAISRCGVGTTRPPAFSPVGVSCLWQLWPTELCHGGIRFWSQRSGASTVECWKHGGGQAPPQTARRVGDPLFPRRAPTIAGPRTVRYLGVDINDGITLAERTEI